MLDAAARHAGPARRDRRHPRPRRHDRHGAGQARHHASRTPPLAGAIAKACHAEGVVVLTAGTYGNVLRFLPPLVIPQAPADRGPRRLELHRRLRPDLTTCI